MPVSARRQVLTVFVGVVGVFALAAVASLMIVLNVLRLSTAASDDIVVSSTLSATALPVAIASTLPIAADAASTAAVPEDHDDDVHSDAVDDVDRQHKHQQPQRPTKQTESSIESESKTLPYFVLHMGPPKTATTTLQSELDESIWRDALAADNYTYAGKVLSSSTNTNTVDSQQRRAQHKDIWNALVGKTCQRELFAMQQPHYNNNENGRKFPACWTLFLKSLTKLEGKA
jgi:hypothetical protein